jgi:hypothetical protein
MIVSWGEIQVGDYIADPNGATWVIDAEWGSQLRARNQIGGLLRFDRPHPSVMVELMWRTDPPIQQTVATVEATLGPTTVVEHDLKMLAFDDMSMVEARRHLWIDHSYVVGGVMVREEMEAAHDHLHAAPPAEGTRIHHHVNPGERIVIL